MQWATTILSIYILGGIENNQKSPPWSKLKFEYFPLENNTWKDQTLQKVFNLVYIYVCI